MEYTIIDTLQTFDVYVNSNKLVDIHQFIEKVIRPNNIFGFIKKVSCDFVLGESRCFVSMETCLEILNKLDDVKKKKISLEMASLKASPKLCPCNIETKKKEFPKEIPPAYNIKKICKFNGTNVIYIAFVGFNKNDEPLFNYDVTGRIIDHVSFCQEQFDQFHVVSIMQIKKCAEVKKLFRKYQIHNNKNRQIFFDTYEEKNIFTTDNCLFDICKLKGFICQINMTIEDANKVVLTFPYDPTVLESMIKKGVVDFGGRKLRLIIDNEKVVWINLLDVALLLKPNNPKKIINRARDEYGVHVNRVVDLDVYDYNDKPKSMYITTVGLYPLVFMINLKKDTEMFGWIKNHFFPAVRRVLSDQA